MRIQYFSDIHLEFGVCDFHSADADVLIAAGDIYPGAEGVGWLAQAECPVIYIAGNHEYYEGDLVHTLNELRDQSNEHDIHFLENDSVEINGVRFLGTTLWTDFDNGNEEILEHAELCMNDYNYIKNDGTKVTPDNLLTINSKSRKWLIAELKKPFPGKTVVVTHHAPTFKSWHEDFDPQLIHTYCNNLNDVIKDHAITLWIHGHVHSTSDYKINDTRVLCNPRGYCDHHPVKDFLIGKTIEI